MGLTFLDTFSLSQEQKGSLSSCLSDESRHATIESIFLNFTGSKPQHLAQAGGRVNLIGEHVDYPDVQFQSEEPVHLFSMGGSVQNSFCVALKKREDDVLRVWHLNAEEGITLSIQDLRDLEGVSKKERKQSMPMKDRSVPAWAFHAFGTLMERDKAFSMTNGYDIVLTSNVPHGAGMSNSAANCIALALTLQADEPALSLDTPIKLVTFARNAENSTYVGGHCGWLDQLLIVCSKKGQLTRIDYAKNAVDHFQSNLAKTWQFCALNTNVPHVLAESEYGDRVKELQLGIQLLRDVAHLPNLGSPTLSLKTLNVLLAQLDISPVASDFDSVDDGLTWSDDECKARVSDMLTRYKTPDLFRHQGLENQESLAILLQRIRHQKASSLIVVAAGEAAAEGDALRFGALLTQEGKSLRMSGDFQITGDNGAQDALLDIGFQEAQKLDLKVFGRMLGGGGGGNVLFMTDRTDEGTYQKWIEQTQIHYAEWAKRLDGNVEATLIEPVMSDGAALIY